MKKNIFVYSALSAALLATFSCSDDNAFSDMTIGNKETINFAPTLDNGGVMTRGTNPLTRDGDTGHNGTDMQKGFVVGVYNTDYNASSLPVKQRTTVNYAKDTKKYTSSPVLYWDNVSADGHDVRIAEGQTGAGSVKIWAANVAGRTCTIGNTTGTASATGVFIDDDGKLDWIISADQTNSSEKNDLLVADYVTKQKATTSAIPLCFHHAMTKITVNIIQGDGFAVADSKVSGSTNEITNNTAVVKLLGQNLKASVDLTKAMGDGKDEVEEGEGENKTTKRMITVSTESANIADVTMHPLTTANTVTGKTVAASFDAIVAEGKELSVATAGSETQIGTIVIGTAPATNTYKIMANADILKAWNGGTAPTDSKLTLKHGVHYILNVTVKKQGIELTAVLAPWTDLTAAAEGQITFTGKNTMISDANTAPFKLPFTIWSKTTGTGAKYVSGSSFEWNFSDDTKKLGYYKYVTDQPIMYWADNNDARYFRAALYENAEVKRTTTTGDNPKTTYSVTGQADVKDGKVSSLAAVEYDKSKDLIWGTSGNSTEAGKPATSGNAVNPTTDSVNLLFKHVLAQVKVKLTTSTDDSKIDLTQVAKVEITNTQTTGGVLDLDKGTVTSSANAASLDLTNSATEKTTSSISNLKYADVWNNAKTRSIATRADDGTSTEIITSIAYEASKWYLVLPQKFAVNTKDKPNVAPKIVITMKDGSTFSADLTTIHLTATENKGIGQTTEEGAQWKQGEKYEYTINITKTKINFTASLLDWVGKTGSGNATMDWD